MKHLFIESTKGKGSGEINSNGGTLAPAIFKPEKNLVFFRIKSRVPEMPPLVSLSD